MILQPIGRFQGQATDVELARKEIKNVKTELVRFMITFYYFFYKNSYNFLLQSFQPQSMVAGY